MVYNIKDYGAVGDGEHLNTNAIQLAIDTAANAGGGIILVTDGIYKTGTITLRSNIELHIASDGIILGSEKCEDYPERNDLRHVDTKNLPRYRNSCMIYSENCKNISITGNGKIDCNGRAFVVPAETDGHGWTYKRIDAPTPPRVVFFTGCQNVKIEDVTMTNQPSGWSYWIHDCDYVTFDKCKILADVQYPNNDGIHINSSRNVTISNCMITCGDDCIIVRANNSSLKENKICERVTVTNCTLTSYANAIRIGWLNDGTIKNCTFSNIVMTDTNVGIAIVLPDYDPNMADKGREASLIENISFNNIIMNDIWMRPIKMFIGNHPETKCNAIQNIYFSKIYSHSSDSLRISGRDDCKIKNIFFSDCNFKKLKFTKNRVEYPIMNNTELISYAENVVFNNTSFSYE